MFWPKTFSTRRLLTWPPNIPSSKMDDHISLSLFSSFPILDPQKLIGLTQFIYQLTSGLNFGNWWYTLALIVSMWLVMLLQNYQRMLIKTCFSMQCQASAIIVHCFSCYIVVMNIYQMLLHDLDFCLWRLKKVVSSYSFIRCLK